MPYDRQSFLSGVAVGRNMESWPAFDRADRGYFAFLLLASSETSMTFCFANLWFEGIIDWGDGTRSEHQLVEIQPHHTYSEPGYYMVSMSGDLWRIWFNSPNSYPDSPKMVIAIQTPFPTYPERRPDPSVPADLVAIQGFTRCSNLIYVPDDPFRNYKKQGLNVTITTSGLFSGCSSLKKIPQNLFVGLTFSTNSEPTFSDMFYGCTSLTEIPEDLFDNDTISTRYTHEMFKGCSGIKHIPSGLFDHFDSSMPLYLYGTFEGSGIEDVPSGLFDNCTLGNCYHAFRNCKNLKTIPAGLFQGQADVETFEEAFSGCEALTGIPDRLFSRCMAATSFYYCFSGCYACQSIGNDVFSDCISAVSFVGCFGACRNITSIPADLFSDLVSAESFSACFDSAESLMAVPSGLFSNCVKAKTLGGCFRNCYGLISVSADAFDGLDSVTSFVETFYRCWNITSAMPTLWLDYPDANGRACFSGCGNAANWTSIPRSWGGPAQG